jgi:multidrug efflux system outer membrane protein
MNKPLIYKCLTVACILIFVSACKTPALLTREVNREVPVSYGNGQDSTNSARLSWREYFADPFLKALIDTAISNNQELNITLQEIAISQNEVLARAGEYRPFVGLRGGAGIEKAARYTNRGSSEATTDIKPGRETPDPLPDFVLNLYAHWEVDIWHKLRNAKKAGVLRYLSSQEGRNFTITNIVAEIATSYYELLALDSQLSILNANIAIQTNALRIVRLQKESAKVSELAVQRFQAQVLNTQSLQYGIQQRITETENRINFLLGRYPQHVARETQNFETLVPSLIQTGIPTQLLENRPDIRQAELELSAAKIDVQVARANFYPSLGLTADLGLRAFNPIYLGRLPESLLASLVGDLAGPLVNKNAIKATYYSANARQIQAIYNYERTVLNAYMEVKNQLSNIDNLQSTYDLKAREVQALNQSITIANSLFSSARADYMEVLLTQRDALETRFDLIETKMQQMNATVNVYRALGGGWN